MLPVYDSLAWSAKSRPDHQATRRKKLGLAGGRAHYTHFREGHPLRMPGRNSKTPAGAWRAQAQASAHGGGHGRPPR